MALKVIGWSYFDCEYPTPKVKGEQFEEMITAVKDAIREGEYVFSGQEHQYSLTGVPVFNDGTCFRASMRCWGSIMAELYVDGNGERLSYMDFYMSLGDASKMPDFAFLDVEPARVFEESCGCTLRQDREIMQQSIDAGMDFVTLDKVLQKKFEEMKKEQNG